MATNHVKVYIYDISQGLARQMSSLLLGKHIEGIWHTGIVCYNTEYFFGSAGIQSCEPGTLVLGDPDEVVDLGTTEVPQELFEKYLNDIGETQFRGDQYHLLDWNCNSFSNEVSIFLTGKPIPDKITSLPKEVMNTALGSMFKPMIDSMSMRSPVGATGGPSASSSWQQPGRQNKEKIFEPRPGQTPANVDKPTSGSRNHVINSKLAKVFDAEPILYEQKETFESLSLLRSFDLREEHQESLDIINAMLVADVLEDFTEQHMGQLDEILTDLSNKSEEALEPLCKVFIALSAHDIPRRLFIKDLGSKLLMQLIHRTRKSTLDGIHTATTRLLVNITSTHQGRQSLLRGEGGVFEQREVLQIGISCLLASVKEQNECGLSLLFNLSLSPVSEELALECCTALVEFSKSERTTLQMYRCLFALRNYIKCGGEEVPSLVSCLGLETVKFAEYSEDIQKICQDIDSLLVS